MTLQDHLNKNSLHHAYLIEGARGEVLPQVLKFLQSLKIKTEGNPDVVQIHTDSFKIDDARNLKLNSSEKGYSASQKIFIISANNFLIEAQNSLLKLFEEPIENTYFFVITTDTSSLLKTLISRFYLISLVTGIKPELKDAEKFITMTQKARLDFIKDLLTVEEVEDEEGNEIPQLDSARTIALKFINALESTLHSKFKKDTQVSSDIFHHFFKIREFLRMPGSSPKTLMESIALVTPSFSK